MKTFMLIILCLACIALTGSSLVLLLLGYVASAINPRIVVEYETLPAEKVTEYITLPPVVRTEYITIHKPYEVIKEVEVEKVIYVDRIVEIVPPNETQTIPWTSQMDIINYVKSTGIPDRKYIVKDYDCDDFALALFYQAWKDRRLIGLLDKHHINDIGEDYHHLMNFTIWKGLIYQVDPGTGNIAPIQTVD